MTMLFLDNRTASFENHYEEMSLSVRVTKQMYKRNSFQKHQELSLKIPIHIKKYNLPREKLTKTFTY